MGRPPSNGGPAFRFTAPEVAEMDAILHGHNNTMPAREVLVALAEKFSESAERKGKIAVQMKQVWNWFQNRRYAIRAKSSKAPGKLTISPVTQTDSTSVRNVPQPIAVPAPTPVVSGFAKGTPENTLSEFEAKSGRDGAWYDVSTFLSHRSLESGDPEVLVRFSGFGPEEDEWVNIKRNIRPRSLPCESSECVAVLPGDLILCFQEGKEQALYYDAHVLDTQRRRHDVRGCRCRFLVRYDHDQSEEIVQLRKICRRPETDYRLQQLHAINEAATVEPQKSGLDPVLLSGPRVHVEAMQKPLIKDAVMAVPIASTAITNVLPLNKDAVMAVPIPSTAIANVLPLSKDAVMGLPTATTTGIANVPASTSSSIQEVKNPDFSSAATTFNSSDLTVAGTSAFPSGVAVTNSASGGSGDNVSII